MQFVHPGFLWALLALAVPIIIHLFYFRRFKKVYFTNVRFLREIKDESSARRKLRNLLVLLMRCLALAFLVFAFAQPFLPLDDAEIVTGQKAVSVFVDNSFSMSSLSQDVPLLEKAKTRARDIIGAYEVEDRFQVLTNDFEGRHQRLLSKEDALSMIDEIELSPAVRNLEAVRNRQDQALGTGATDNRYAYLISDFQKNITDLDGADTTTDLTLVPLQSVQERNVAIDTAYFEAPARVLNQTNPLIVRVRNYGNEDADNIRLALRLDGQVQPVGTLSVPAGRSVTDTVNMTLLRTGTYEAALELTDFPVQFDDKYFLSFKVAQTIRVLVVNGGGSNEFLNKAFRNLPNFELTEQSAREINYSALSDYQLIVLNELPNISTGLGGALADYTGTGGNLLVFPAANADRSSYNNFLRRVGTNELLEYRPGERIVGRINTDEFVFSDVFENRSANLRLPTTQADYRLSRYSDRAEESLLTYRDGSTALGKYRHNEGTVYLSAAPLDVEISNLARSGEIFVPLLYKSAISGGRARPIAYTIGRDEVLQSAARTLGNETVYRMTGDAEEFIPEQRTVGSRVYLNVNGQVPGAGFYDLFLDPAESLETYAFNFDRRESDLAVLNTEALRERVGASATILEQAGDAGFALAVTQRSRGTILWRWCLIAALLFLLVEVLLLRFWRV